MCATMKNSCTKLIVWAFAALIARAVVCAEAGKCVVTYTFDDACRTAGALRDDVLAAPGGGCAVSFKPI